MTVPSRAWLNLLRVGAVLACAYFLLAGNVQVLAYQVFGLMATIGILVATRRQDRGVRLPWYLLAAGQALWVIGDTIFNVAELQGVETVHPAPADLIYIAAYPLWVAGIWLLVRRATRGADHGAFIDAAIVATGVGIVAWVYFVIPTAQDPALSDFAKGASIAGPLMDVLMVAGLARLALSAGRGTVSHRLLIGSLSCYLFSDLVYGSLELAGAYSPGHPIDFGWFAASLLMAAAALHPSARPVPGLVEPDFTRLGTTRLVLLGSAAMLAPAVLIIQTLTGGDAQVPVVAAGSMALLLLAGARMAGLLRAQRRTLLTQTVLRTAAADLVAATDREEIEAIAMRTAKALTRRDVEVTLTDATPDRFRIVASDGARSRSWARRSPSRRCRPRSPTRWRGARRCASRTPRPSSRTFPSQCR